MGIAAPYDAPVADPFAILGVRRDASPEEVTAAYRRLAKRWHPDRAAEHQAALRMAEINAAYDLLRSERWLADRGRSVAPQAQRPDPARAARRTRGAWLPEPIRRALGGELLAALEEGEKVALVTPASTWASPQALLALTDRRLLWLLDDVPTHRVRSLRLRDIGSAESHVRRPRGRSATLRVRTTAGRRLTFAGLRPVTAAEIARGLGA
jgi:DnaJ-like protein